MNAVDTNVLIYDHDPLSSPYSGFHLGATHRWCGTGSGSDLVLPRRALSEAPGRYRSLYRTGRTRLKIAVRL